MRKPFRIIGLCILTLLLINLSFWLLIGFRFSPFNELSANGLVIKLPQLNKAYAFVHGKYMSVCPNRTVSTEELEGCTYLHVTGYQNEKIATLSFVENLHREGYTKIWGTWCQSGNHDFIYRLPQGEEIPWPDYVSRNEKPGKTIPVFVGAGFVRVSV